MLKLNKKLLIESEIHKIIDSRNKKISRISSDFDDIWQIAIDCMTGGKLLRPLLLINTYDALTQENKASEKDRNIAFELAAAIEILHFSFLLHDDIIDEDILRRGRPNLVGRLLEAKTSNSPNKLHWARSSTLVIGDLMLSIAHQVFARIETNHIERIKILNLLDEAIAETVVGEFFDVTLADKMIDSDLKKVLKMTRLKTATYSFELPLRIAAILAKESDKTEEELGQIGQHFGIAFQLKDDLLCAFGESDTHGKDNFSDFREGKETALIAFARTTNAWPDIKQLLETSNFNSESGIAIQKLLIECGAQAFIENKILEHNQKVVEILNTSDSYWV